MSDCQNARSPVTPSYSGGTVDPQIADQGMGNFFAELKRRDI
jgi:hypothetical protein